MVLEKKIFCFVIIRNFSVSLRVFQDKSPKTNIVQDSLLAMLNYYRRRNQHSKAHFPLFPLSFDSAFQQHP